MILILLSWNRKKQFSVPDKNWQFFSLKFPNVFFFAARKKCCKSFDVSLVLMYGDILIEKKNFAHRDICSLMSATAILIFRVFFCLYAVTTLKKLKLKWLNGWLACREAIGIGILFFFDKHRSKSHSSFPFTRNIFVYTYACLCGIQFDVQYM